MRDRGLVPVSVDGQAICLAPGPAGVHAQLLRETEENEAQLVVVPVEAAVGSERHGSRQSGFPRRPENRVPGVLEDHTFQGGRLRGRMDRPAQENALKTRPLGQKRQYLRVFAGVVCRLE